MKPDTRVLEVNSTLQGEKVGMTIDDGALAHIMSVLTDLYSDPEMAIIREYSTNAYDAHVEAGVKKPIQVTTPTSLAPFFRVRDFGEGLDAQDIREIYSRYGASSKRDSNDVVGMLGLGCKSALTYTDQFTLTGIKNGIETQVSISRDEDGGGSMTIVAQNKTDAESGVEIIVPVKRHNDIVSKCATFFSVWEKGTVLVDGEEPQSIDGMPLTDKIFTLPDTDRYSQKYSQIVMGNVTYPITDQYDSWPFLAYVEIGEVDFTPSREALQMTKKTRAKIEQLRATVKVERDAAVERNIAQAKTASEAIEIYHTSLSKGYRGNPSWKGHTIPQTISAPDGDQWIIAKLKHQSYSRGWDHYRNIGTQNLYHYIWFVGFESDTLTPYKRKKLNQWASKQNLVASNAILVKTLPKSPWIEKNNVYDWKDVEAEKIDRVTSVTSKGRPTGAYRGYVCNLYQDVILAEDIDPSKPLFYSDTDLDLAKTVIFDYYPDATYIALSSNRVAKFKRDFPTAKKVEDEYKKLKTAWEKSLTDDDKLSLKLNGGSYIDTLKKLDPAQVDDPELKNYITIAKRNLQKLSARARLFGHQNYNSYYYDNDDSVKPFKEYPLLTNLRGYDRLHQNFLEHLYTYVNAAYAARQEKN